MANDPFAWLVDMLTEAWGQPKVKPPAAEGGDRAYRSDVDGLIWVRLSDRSRRAWAWFPNGRNHNLAIEKGAVCAVSMGGPRYRATLERQDTWTGLTREVVEPVARWVYGIQAAKPEAGDQP